MSNSVKRLSPAEIRKVWNETPLAERTPDAVLIDNILREFWRMEKPSKAKLLERYRERCASGLKESWLRAHCEVAAFCETLIGTDAAAKAV